MLLVHRLREQHQHGADKRHLRPVELAHSRWQRAMPRIPRWRRAIRIPVLYKGNGRTQARAGAGPPISAIRVTGLQWPVCGVEVAAVDLAPSHPPTCHRAAAMRPRHRSRRTVSIPVAVAVGSAPALNHASRLLASLTWRGRSTKIIRRATMRRDCAIADGASMGACPTRGGERYVVTRARRGRGGWRNASARRGRACRACPGCSRDGDQQSGGQNSAAQARSRSLACASAISFRTSSSRGVSGPVGNVLRACACKLDR